MLSAPAAAEGATIAFRPAGARSPKSVIAAAAVSLLVTGMAIVPFAPVQGVDSNVGHLSAGTQSVAVASEVVASGGARDTFGAASAPVVTSSAITAPAAGVPDPGTAQAIAYDMMAGYGWDDTQYSCLVALWERESHWNVYAYNASSGAYGIPQALPGEKMASVAADWATNPATQITWGLGYISGRYGTPCAAWESSETRGWY